MSYAEVKVAASAAEREAIYRFRYEVYVEQMHLYRSTADHERRWLRDVDDDGAVLLYAALGGQVAGTIRINFGADAPFSREAEDTYELGRFRPVVPDAQMAVDARFI